MSHVLIVALAAVVLAGCTERLPTEATQAQSRTAPQYGMAGDRYEPLGGIDDALDRILPALTDQGAAIPLAGALNGLRNALASAHVQGIPSLVGAAHAAVDRYARTGEDAADLDAIRLGLDYAAEALTYAN